MRIPLLLLCWLGFQAPPETVDPELDRIVKAFDPGSGGFHGSVLVARGGKILLEKGYGLADAATGRRIDPSALWDWASVSKQFTAAAVLKLQDQGKLKLEDPLSRFFPDAPKDRAGVTLRQLLAHVSGLEPGFGPGWEFEPFDRASFEACFMKRPVEAKPGEKWSYSNSGYAMAAAIVERVSGRSFEDYVKGELFGPAGMKDATFIGAEGLDKTRVPRPGRGKGLEGWPEGATFAYGDRMSWGYRGAGGAVATARDFWHWDRALRGEKVLSAKAKGELFKGVAADYALGWYVLKAAGGRRAEHGGGVRGVTTYVMRGLEEDAVVALAGDDSLKAPLQHLAESLWRAAAGRK